MTRNTKSNSPAGHQFSLVQYFSNFRRTNSRPTPKSNKTRIRFYLSHSGYEVSLLRLIAFSPATSIPTSLKVHREEHYFNYGRNSAWKVAFKLGARSSRGLILRLAERGIVACLVYHCTYDQRRIKQRLPL